MKKRFWEKIVMLATVALFVTPTLTGCASISASSASGSAGSEANTINDDETEASNNPEELRIGILNGSLIDAIADAEGYYDEFESETGVTASIYYFESGRDVNNAYASKSIDVATFGSSPISLGTTNKLGYEVIYLNDLIGNIEALAVTDDIDSPEDLSGKTIATPFASTSHYSLLNYLEANNIEDANIIDLEPQDILAAWQRGDVDGAYVWSPVLAEIKKDGKVLISSAELSEEGVITADISTASKDYADSYPSVVTAFVEIQNKVYELIVNNKEQAIKDVQTKLDISEEEAEEQIDGSVWISLEEQIDAKYLGTTEEKGSLAATIKSTADFHVSQGNLEESLELQEYEDSVDPGFAEELLNK